MKTTPEKKTFRIVLQKNEGSAVTSRHVPQLDKARLEIARFKLKLLKGKNEVRATSLIHGGATVLDIFGTLAPTIVLGSPDSDNEALSRDFNAVSNDFRIALQKVLDR